MAKKKTPDRGRERKKRRQRLERNSRAVSRKQRTLQIRNSRPSYLDNAPDEWIPKRVLRRMHEPPDEMVY